jgi:hypothetical protein
VPRAASPRVLQLVLVIVAFALGASRHPDDIQAAVQTVTFDDTASQNQPLNGQYPTGVIDWGTGAWFLSGPWGAFTTRNVSFANSGLTTANFTFSQPRRLLSLDAFNGGSGSSSVMIACAGQTTKSQSVPAGAVVNIQTGWTGTCSSVTITSSNGWNTNLDNLTFDDGPLPNLPPSVSAGQDQVITLPVNSVSLDATITDDAQPGSLSQTWTGPAGVTFGAASSVDTLATLPGAGTFVLRLTASDGALSAWDEVSITVNSSPINPTLIITSPTEGQMLQDATTVSLQYLAAGNLSEADHAHFRLDGGATVMDLDFDGSYTFSNVPAGNHTVVGILARATHSEIAGSEHTVNFSTTTPDASAPDVAIVTPAEAATVSGTLNVTASAIDNVGVDSVQFLLDGNPLGAQDTTLPYSVAWNTTTVTNGVHVLTAIARDTSANQAVSVAVQVLVNNADVRSQVGEWGPIMNWPLVSVHANLLHTGEVLLWDDDSGDTQPRLWDPTTNTMTQTALVPAPIICAGVVALADGRLLIVGGHIPFGGENGITNTYIYDPIADTWTRTGDMIDPRYYPSVARLSDGDVAIFSGQILTDNWSPKIEIYDSGTGTTSQVPGIGVVELREEEYPAIFNLPDGDILAISPQIGPVMRFDPEGETWTNVNVTPVKLGSSVQYRPGKILMSGGAPSFGAPSSSAASILDINVGSPVWTSTAPMNSGRYFHQLLMLPSGDVFAVGGAPTASIYSASGVLQPEVWNPDTESWTALALQTAPRMYHSTSVLLPDGRILTAGGGRSGPAPNQFNAQVYSPPYLFKGPRPVITDAPAEVSLGSVFTLDSPDASDIASVTLVDLATTTHSTFMSQIFQELSFTSAAGRLTVDAPASPDQVPPGYYMVFAVDSSGIPSVAEIIKFNTTQILTSVDVTPQTDSVPAGGTREFAASVLDQFGQPMNPQPQITWSVSGGGTIDASGLFSAGPTPGGPHTVTASIGSTQDTSGVTVTAPDPPPTISDAAAANPNPSSGTTSNLSVLGADNNVESTLIYTWSLVSGPPSGGVSFSLNGSNAAKNTVVTFTRAGSYTLRVQVLDDAGQAVHSDAQVIVSQSPGSISVAPAMASVPIGGMQQFTASALDQFGQPASPQPAFGWSVSGGGSIAADGQFSAGSTPGGPHSVTASADGLTGTASVSVLPATQTITFDDRTGQNQSLNGQYPTGVVNWGTGQWYHSAAWKLFTTKSASFLSGGQTSASFSFVTPRRLVSVRAYNGGTASSTVTLACTGQTTRSVVVAAGTVSTIATNWTGTCTTVTVTSSNGWNTNIDDLVHDSGGVQVNAAPTVNAGPDRTITLPATASLDGTVNDDGLPAPPAQLSISWSKISGPGSVSFGNASLADTTASFTLAGAYTLRLTVSDSVLSSTDDVAVSVLAANSPPTVATSAAAVPNPVTATSGGVSALGADDGGEAALNYTWAATGPAAVTFTPNATNGARNSIATFSAAGSYTLEATIADAGGQSVKTSVGVVVQQTATAIAVTPATASVPIGSTQQFTASALDQFGQPTSPQPGFSWSVSGGGSIAADGRFTAGPTAGGPHSVSASAGGLTGTAGVSVIPATQTITFDDRAGQNQSLNGQYPNAVINWGTGQWYHSGPWNLFTTKSLSFLSGGQTSASFSFVTPRRLVSVRAYNGGSVASTVTLACSGQTTRSVAVAVGTVVTIATNWTGTCTTGTFTSSNGWNTNFDDLVHDAGGAP